METKKTKDTSWFIFTDDDYTNQVIVEELQQEDTFYQAKCSDGVLRKLWVCDAQFVLKMMKNKQKKELTFDVYKRIGKPAPIIKCNFNETKKSLTKI